MRGQTISPHPPIINNHGQRLSNTPTSMIFYILAPAAVDYTPTPRTLLVEKN
jgi:hypothetical protein